MMKRIFAVVFFLPLFTVATIYAQSPEELSAKYGITFPIAELDNCANYSDCRLYCEIPANHERCTQFAREKGFYKQEVSAEANQEDILRSAQYELGCETIASCRQFCSHEKNWQMCGEFAKKHHLSGGQATSSHKEEILKLAQVELGCESYDECMSYCEKKENMERCADFAARHKLSGNAAQMSEQMAQVKRLLGCSSMKSCEEYCSNPANAPACTQAFRQAGFDTGETTHADEPPEMWCPKISTECRWDGQSCNCSGSQTGVGARSESTQESGEVWCPKLPGCSWTGSQCDCTNRNNIPTVSEPTRELQQQVDPSLECSKYGCTFDGKTCQCPQSEQHTIDFSEQPPSIQGPVQECESAAPGCFWDGIDCRCPGNQPTTSSQVHGVTTTGGLLLQILYFLLNRL